MGALNKWIADGKCAGGECSGALGRYSGKCSGDEDCHGPAWLCKCNNCDDSVDAVIDECNGVTFEGCCEQDGTLKYCEESVAEKAEGTANDYGRQPEYEKEAAEEEIPVQDIQQNETIDSISQEDTSAGETSSETGKEETQYEISQNEETTATDFGTGTAGGGCPMKVAARFNPETLLLMIILMLVLPLRRPKINL